MATSDNDPRMLEMRFLSDLIRFGFRQIVPWDQATAYGITPAEFQHLVLHLIAEECLISQGGAMKRKAVSKHGPAGPIRPRDRLWGALPDPLDEALAGDTFMAAITHQGRLRLWRLRDEMDRRRIRDSFGVLIDGRHFDEDLRIRTWMLAPDAPLTVAQMDLDHFKAVNDSLGHGQGDVVIKRYLEVARTLVSAAGGEAYRLGGDEVWMLFPEMPEAEAKATGERLRAAVEREFADVKPALKDPLTSSMGMVTFSGPSTLTNEQMRKVVDDRTYDAKRAGRNCVVHAVEA